VIDRTVLHQGGHELPGRPLIDNVAVPVGVRVAGGVGDLDGDLPRFLFVSPVKASENPTVS